MAGRLVRERQGLRGRKGSGRAGWLDVGKGKEGGRADCVLAGWLEG